MSTYAMYPPKPMPNSWLWDFADIRKNWYDGKYSPEDKLINIAVVPAIWTGYEWVSKLPDGAESRWYHLVDFPLGYLFSEIEHNEKVCDRDRHIVNTNESWDKYYETPYWITPNWDSLVARVDTFGKVTRVDRELTPTDSEGWISFE